MKNITGLRDELYDLLYSLKGEGVDVNAAKQMNNAAGNIVDTLKIELKYNQAYKIEKRIKFMEGGK
jgi:hypothetical protein